MFNDLRSAVGSQRSVLVIGIDGGGTHTRAILANARGETLGTGEAGTANPNAHGYPAAQNEILAAIQRAFDDARIEKQIVTAAGLGIGGVDRPEERVRFQTWAKLNVAQRAAIMNDSEIVLAAGSPDNWGVALIAGTGSMAFGKSRAGKTARAGGWGYLIGDEGSGFDLGRSALRAATQAADGRGEPTQLLAAILDHWKLEHPQQLIPHVYHSGLKPADFAQLASVVVRAAKQGDAIALDLLEQSATSLATTIVAVARALDFREVIPLAMTGGLLIETESIRARLVEIAQQHGYHFSPMELVLHPVLGAVKSALRLAQSE